MPFASKHSNPKTSNIPEEREDYHIGISVSISPISNIEEISDDTQSFAEQTGRQDPVYGVDQPVKKKIVQVADDTVKPVAAGILSVEITSASGVTLPGTSRIYEGGCK